MLLTLAVKRCLMLTATLLFALVVAALGQTTEPPDRPVNSPANNKDRAGHLADLVSLSPATITQLLQREPGLLLEVKKALVRKAYEEGRLLNPEDLTDESVFQLLQDDAAARSLATREIEARMYVRAKPNADELHQDPDRTIVEKASFQGRGSTEQSSSGNQEAQYWATHEELPLNQPQAGATSQDEEEAPAQRPNRVSPPGILQNPRLQPSLTATESAVPEWFSPPEAVATPNVNSAGFSGMLNASLSGPVDAFGGVSAEPRRNTPQIVTSAPLPEALIPHSVSGFSMGKNASGIAVPWLAVPPQSLKIENESDASRAGLHRQANPYQDVPSLYDLYKQFSKRSPAPQRFGMDVFQNGTGNTDQLPMDVPAGPDYNMTDIQAAIGLHQLRKLPEFHRRRKEIAARYDQAFRELDELEIPVEQNWAEHARHLYVLRLRLDRLTISRDEFVNELRRRNIGTSVHFIPVHLFTYYRERYQYSPQDFPIASAEFQRIVSLPCSPAMSDDDVEDVIAAVTSVIEENSVRRTSTAAFSATGS